MNTEVQKRREYKKAFLLRYDAVTPYHFFFLTYKILKTILAAKLSTASFSLHTKFKNYNYRQTLFRFFFFLTYKILKTILAAKLPTAFFSLHKK